MKTDAYIDLDMENKNKQMNFSFLITNTMYLKYHGYVKVILKSQQLFLLDFLPHDLKCCKCSHSPQRVQDNNKV